MNILSLSNRNKSIYSIAILLLIIALTLAACGGDKSVSSQAPATPPTPEPTATPTQEPPTPTPEPTNTPEPTATNTPEPTATSTPEPTATSTPKPTPTETITINSSFLSLNVLKELGFKIEQIDTDGPEYTTIPVENVKFLNGQLYYVTPDNLTLYPIASLSQDGSFHCLWITKGDERRIATAEEIHAEAEKGTIQKYMLGQIGSGESAITVLETVLK